MPQKTEKPTARRLRQARAAGDVPLSDALTQAMALAAVAALTPAAAAYGTALFSASVAAALGGPPDLGAAARLGPELLIAIGPLLAAAALAVALATVAQTGGNLVSPFGARGHGKRAPALWPPVRALTAALLLTVVLLLVGRSLLPEMAQVSGDITSALRLSGSATQRLLWWATACALVVAAADWAVLKRAWSERLKMSRQELRDELKQTEGDPDLVARRKQAHRELATGQGLTAASGAEVVLHDGGRLAVFLSYDEHQDVAPPLQLVARGPEARAALQLTRRLQRPEFVDPLLCRALAAQSEEHVLPQSYAAVASYFARSRGSGSDRV